MVAETIPVDPFDYLVFGGTGDLSYRKLYPALYYRLLDGQIPEGCRIVGLSRHKLAHDDFVAGVKDALTEFVAADDLTDDVFARFATMLHHITIDVMADETGWQDLCKFLSGHEADETERVRVFYLATSPALFGAIANGLDVAGLISAQARIVLEKPIGTDLASANEINDAVGAHFDEKAIYRIDHYLGKETVQNLMALRFANALFEPLWSGNTVDHIQITVAESVGVGGRGGYYDHAGAIRDMVQNHLVQLLCLTAMEPPSAFDADAVRDEKLKVLKALRPITSQNVRDVTVRGQYAKGAIDDQAVPGYLEEGDVPEDSQTETFCVIKAQIENWRWAGVPFYLRTGKRMADRVSEIVVAFNPVPHSIFSDRAGRLEENRLIIRLQPDEGIKMDLMTKEPGPGGMRLRPAHLNLSFAEQFKDRSPDAYERLLMDVVRGDQTLFMRRDEVEAAWQWIEPILTEWQAMGDAPQKYTAGSWGPSASVALIERDGRSWLDDHD